MEIGIGIEKASNSLTLFVNKLMMLHFVQNNLQREN